MKRIFLCSPYAAPTPEGIEANVALARRLCAEILAQGHAPYAPHLYLPTILDDAKPEERERGMMAGMAWLQVCDEVWAWGAVSKGMAIELGVAQGLGKPIKFPWGRE